MRRARLAFAFPESETAFFVAAEGNARATFDVDSAGVPTAVVLRQGVDVRRATRRP
jgi:hypothetical protein